MQLPTEVSVWLNNFEKATQLLEKFAAHLIRPN